MYAEAAIPMLEAPPTPLFTDYGLGPGYDEMFASGLRPRPAYEGLLSRLQELTPIE